MKRRQLHQHYAEHQHCQGNPLLHAQPPAHAGHPQDGSDGQLQLARDCKCPSIQMRRCNEYNIVLQRVEQRRYQQLEQGRGVCADVRGQCAQGRRHAAVFDNHNNKADEHFEHLHADNSSACEIVVLTRRLFGIIMVMTMMLMLMLMMMMHLSVLGVREP